MLLARATRTSTTATFIDLEKPQQKIEKKMLAMVKYYDKRILY